MKIEKGIPIPPSKTERSELFTILSQLEIGDSVLVEGDIQNRTRAKAVAMNLRHRSEKDFITRRVKNGLRIWRTL